MSEPYATCQYIKCVSLYTFIRTQNPTHACHRTISPCATRRCITYDLVLTCQHTILCNLVLPVHM